jgi:diguanylate cyclase (GGDEF)-like protein
MVYTLSLPGVLAHGIIKRSHVIPDPADISPENILRSVWGKHRDSVFEHVDTIESAVNGLVTGKLDDHLLSEAQRAAHTLAGSAGTFGFMRATEAASQLELGLADSSNTQVPLLRTLVIDLRRDLEREIAIPKPAPSAAVSVEHPRAARVLIVDDDPLALDAMRGILEPHDLEVFTLTEPLCFWEKLEEVAPELLILDVDMPGVNGPDLCRAVRDDARWSGLAVIFVTAAGDAATIEGLFRVGADDHLAKPIVGKELLTRVSNRLKRVRLYRAQAETDDLTGLANRAKANAELTRLLGLADRFSQPLSIAMLDLDRFKQINDTHGHASGDSVLRALGERLRLDFRDNDVAGRWGGEEFIIGMYGMQREDALRRLTDTLHRFGEEKFTSTREVFQASFSAGVAEYPLDGPDLPTVIGTADQALYDAKAAGRACVRDAGEKTSIELCDVVCVEDDQVLAELLQSSLRTRGYNTRCLDDGEQARLALCGSPPTLRCRVLLLDIDLPGLDGHSLLRQLAGHDVLRSTRVIMLTARASETDTIKALELGAFDHVAKPFSLPVLMHRIQIAITT